MTLVSDLAEAAWLFGASIITFAGASDAHALGARLSFGGHAITVRFAPEHPCSPTWVYLNPAPVHPHYYVHAGERVARLCWCHPAEWRPTYGLVVALGCAIRFLNEEVR